MWGRGDWRIRRKSPSSRTENQRTHLSNLVFTGDARTSALTSTRVLISPSQASINASVRIKILPFLVPAWAYDRNVHSPYSYHRILCRIVIRIWCYIQITTLKLLIACILSTCLTDISLILWEEFTYQSLRGVKGLVNLPSSTLFGSAQA